MKYIIKKDTYPHTTVVVRDLTGVPAFWPDGTPLDPRCGVEQRYSDEVIFESNDLDGYKVLAGGGRTPETGMSVPLCRYTLYPDGRVHVIVYPNNRGINPMSKWYEGPVLT